MARVNPSSSARRPIAGPFAWLCLLVIGTFLLPSAAQASPSLWPSQVNINEKLAVVEALLRKLSHTENADDRSALFAEAEETALGVGFYLKRADAFSAIATMQTQVGDQEAARRAFDKALGTARGVKNLALRARILRRVGFAMEEAGDPEAARQIMDEASEADKSFIVKSNEIVIRHNAQGIETYNGNLLPPIFSPDPVTPVDPNIIEEDVEADEIAKFVRWNIKRKEFKLALLAARREAADTFRQGLLNEIAKAAISERDYVSAFDILRHIENAKRRDGHYHNIVRTKSSWGDFEGAINTVQYIENPSMRDWMFSRISEYQVEAGDFDTAIATVRMMVDAVRRSYRLADMGDEQIVAGNALAAKIAYDFALGAASGIDGVHRVIIIANIAAQMAEVGDFDGAIATVSKLDPSSHWRVGSANGTIIRLLLKKGDFDGAVAAIDTLQEGSERNHSLARAMRTLVARDALDHVIEIAKRIDGTQYHDDALHDLARARIKAGDTAAARHLARAIDDPEQKSNILADVAQAQAKSGALHAAVATVGDIADSQPEQRGKALMAIASAQMLAGDLVAAYETASSIPDPVTYALTMAILAGQQANQSDIEAARATFALAREAVGRIPSYNRGLVEGIVEGHYKDAFPEQQ